MSLMPLTAEEVKAFRRAVGLSQVGLAEALGAGRRTVEDWETATNRPPAMLRLAFAALNAQLAPWGTPLSADGMRRLDAARTLCAQSRFEIKLVDLGEDIVVQGSLANGREGRAVQVTKARIDTSETVLDEAIQSVNSELLKLER